MTTANSGKSIFLDNYSGTDDQKLTSAMNAATNLGGNVILNLPARAMSFAVKGRVPRSKLAIVGASRAGEITLNFDSQNDVGWFHNTTSLCSQAQFWNLALRSNSGSVHPAFLTNTSSSPGYQQLVVHSIQSSGLWGVCGTAGQRIFLTACTFSGPDWDINNGWNTAFYMGGSDNVFWTDGLLIDSPGTPDGNSHTPAGSSIPHIRIGYMDKSSFGRIYSTNTGNWSGLLYEGQDYNSGSANGNGGPCTFDGCIWEGRNRAKPCYDAVVKVTGGQPIFRDNWFAYGMTASNSGAGMVHISGGFTRIQNPTYDPADGVALTLPLVYATGAGVKVRISDGSVGSKSGAWGDPRPRYTAASSASITADNSFLST